MNAQQPAPTWVRELGRRMRYRPLLKALGTTVFMSVFFIGYFHVLRNPLFAATQMPLTALDRMIAFYPPALLAYASLWFYVGIPPGLLLSFKELVHYGVWVGALCCTGLLCFLLWPTVIPGQLAPPVAYPGFGILAGVDAKANACPSLHVATAVFSALWIDRLLREMGAGAVLRTVNWLWVLAIAYSTLAIKQHVALDALGGLALGLFLGFLSLRLRPNAPLLSHAPAPTALGKPRLP